MTATNITTTSADTIIEGNRDVIVEYFSGLASCAYYDGSCYRLYLDLNNNSMFIGQDHSTSNWLQRDDSSLVILHTTNGYCDTPVNERYNAERGDDLSDFGYLEWVDYELTPKIENVIEQSE